MDLIEEIKRAEAEADKIKKQAEQKGIHLLEQVKLELEQRFDRISHKRAEYIKESQQEVEKIVAEQRKVIEDEYKKLSNELNSKIKDSKDRAVERVQEIILRWQQSR